MSNEELNHQAYIDVLEAKEPILTNNEYYMQCYRFWRSIATENHFEPFSY